VPSVCRRIVVLLVVALLGAGSVAVSVPSAFAQGAGDQQYSDPFGDSDSGSGSSGSSGSGSSGTTITPSPQTGSSGSTGSGTSGSSSGTSSGTAGTTSSGTTSTPSVAASGQLPNTGLDARVLVLAGVALLLLGVGLRMRNAPERF
jgi:LPXTG-motif cell wall-anchored protein